MSPRLSTVCAMPLCPVVTKGNYCTRHGNMTEAEEIAEHHEMKRRNDRFMALWEDARRLRNEGADEEDLEAAQEAAEEARLYLAELFGEPIDEPE